VATSKRRSSGTTGGTAARAVVAPCGRCRELLVQVDRRNFDCEVLLPDGASAALRELLPNAWLEHLLVSR